jgi:hypothetical protein
VNVLSVFHQTLMLVALIKNKQGILSWDVDNGNNTENVQHSTHWTISFACPTARMLRKAGKCEQRACETFFVTTQTHIQYLQMNMKHSFCIL